MANQPLPAVPLLTLREPDLTNISVFPAPLSVAEYPLRFSHGRTTDPTFDIKFRCTLNWTMQEVFCLIYLHFREIR